MDIKIIARERARKLCIPVVMDTSDRGMIDVERFDLEPDRPLLHGLIAHLDPLAASRAKTNEEKLPFLAPIAGLSTLSPRMKASMVEIGQTISTWPQLGSNVALGGAVTADVCRRIALGQFTSSGRWYVDPEGLLADQASPAHSPPSTLGSGPELSKEEMIVMAERTTLGPSGIPLSDVQARGLAEAAALAPSAGNAQPWCFLLHEGHLFVFHDRSRSASRLDPDHFIDHVGLGMCIENIMQRATHLGIGCETDLFPRKDDQRLIAVISGRHAIRSSATAPEDLSEQIPLRHTNRRRADGRAIDLDHLKELKAAGESVDGATIHLTREKAVLDRLGGICGSAERLRLLNPHAHQEFFQRELRWTAEDANRTGDGLDINTLEMTRAGVDRSSGGLRPQSHRADPFPSWG